MLECFLRYDAGINAESGGPRRKSSGPKPEVAQIVKNDAIEERGEKEEKMN
jgi:hypothetical protein